MTDPSMALLQRIGDARAARRVAKHLTWSASLGVKVADGLWLQALVFRNDPVSYAENLPPRSDVTDSVDLISGYAAQAGA